MKRHKRNVMLLGALVVLLGSTSCSWWSRDDADKIVLSGNIELTQVEVAFKTPGKIVELAVEEGDEVRKGMVLARLDVDQLENQRSRDQAAVAAAESQRAQQLTAIEFQRATLEADVDARRAAAAQAEARLAELLAGSREEEIKQAKAVFAEARTQHSLASQDWERARVLYSNDDISTAQRDQFRTRFEAATAALERAGEQLALVQAGPRREVIDAARAQVRQAQAAVRSAEAARLELKRKQEELATRQAQIAQAKAQVAIVESQLSDAVVGSPVNGIVLLKSAEAGEIVAAGTTLLTVGEVDRPWLRGYITEQDLGKVRIGAKARVTTDSYPGKVYQGRVSFIASEAEFTPKQIQTHEERVKLVYRVKIELENPQHELKLNMPADAEILLSEK